MHKKCRGFRLGLWFMLQNNNVSVCEKRTLCDFMHRHLHIFQDVKSFWRFTYLCEQTPYYSHTARHHFSFLWYFFFFGGWTVKSHYFFIIFLQCIWVVWNWRIIHTKSRPNNLFEFACNFSLPWTPKKQVKYHRNGHVFQGYRFKTGIYDNRKLREIVISFLKVSSSLPFLWYAYPFELDPVILI